MKLQRLPIRTALVLSKHIHGWGGGSFSESNQYFKLGKMEDDLLCFRFNQIATILFSCYLVVLFRNIYFVKKSTRYSSSLFLI